MMGSYTFFVDLVEGKFLQKALFHTTGMICIRLKNNIDAMFLKN